MFFPSDNTIREHMELQKDNDTRSLEEYTIDSWADFNLLGVDGEYISFTNKFCYLGTIISSYLSDDADISRRIQQASKAFGSLIAGVFCNQNISALRFVADCSWPLSSIYYYGAARNIGSDEATASAS